MDQKEGLRDAGKRTLDHSAFARAWPARYGTVSEDQIRAKNRCELGRCVPAIFDRCSRRFHRGFRTFEDGLGATGSHILWWSHIASRPWISLCMKAIVQAPRSFRPCASPRSARVFSFLFLIRFRRFLCGHGTELCDSSCDSTQRTQLQRFRDNGKSVNVSFTGINEITDFRLEITVGTRRREVRRAPSFLQTSWFATDGVKKFDDC